jgi:type I restriction enzyme S subunit
MTMNVWPIVRIDELCEVTSSKRIYAKELCPSGVPFFRSREIIEKLNGQETPSNPLFISEERFQEILRETGAPRKGDVLLTSRGTLGVPYIVKDIDRFHFADGNLTWFRNFRQLDSRYLKYFFLSPSGKAELTRCVIGSSQPAYTIASLKKIEISLPPLAVQRRIVGILSAYDDLIENNQRRIKILEQMARSLYREWFVNFRYPGHEKVPLVDSPLGKIPKLWDVRRLEKVCRSIQDGDWIETKDQGGNDYRLLQISNIGVGEFIETGNYRFVTQATLSNYAARRLSLVISWWPGCRRRLAVRGWLPRCRGESSQPWTLPSYDPSLEC